MDYGGFLKVTGWVYRFGFPKGETHPTGISPFTKTHTGAQVAPQRCPILLCGKSTFYYITLIIFLKGSV